MGRTMASNENFADLTARKCDRKRKMTNQAERCRKQDVNLNKKHVDL